MRLSSKSILTPLVCLSLTACGTLSPAELDQQVTVNENAALYEYRRIGLEPTQCEGDRCHEVNGPDLLRTLKQSLTSACYEIVDDGELQRYYETLFQEQGGIDWAAGRQGTRRRGAMRFFSLDPVAQQVMTDELDLAGLLKATVIIGQPQEATGWRTVAVDYELIDSRRKNALWQARLEGHLSEHQEVNELLQGLTRQLAGAIGRRANACGQPEAEPAFEVHQGVLDLPDRIYFELGSATISTRSYTLLDELAQWFADNPQVKMVRIEGHTDDVGDDDANLRLSEQRAQAVRAYLVGKGVAIVRMEPIGFGETRPLVANEDALSRSKNRRVELRVIE